MGWSKGQGPIRSEAKAKRGRVAGPMSKEKPNFTPAQISAIKKSPAGKLPGFLNVSTNKGRDGAEFHANVGKTHVSGGYSKSRKSAGLDIRRKNKSFSVRVGG